MIDKEKVIKGLKCLTNTTEAILPTKERCENCPWSYKFLNDFGFETWGCNEVGCMKDALILLKEQEPQKPELKHTNVIPLEQSEIYGSWYRCLTCKCGYIYEYAKNYCPHCGAKIDKIMPISQRSLDNNAVEIS